ncbi:MAG: hypothetical protein WDW36_003638 [Sanguina aurantia]
MMQASLSEADGGEAGRLRRGGRRSTGNDAGPIDAAPTEQGGAGFPSGRSAGGRGRRGEQQQQHAAGGSSREVQHGADGSDAIMEAVVKVFCIHCEPNYSLPWQRKRQYSSSSSGFIIEGRRILTNAHCVDHHTQVKVKRRGSDEKYVAQVLSVGTECDIAMLTVADPAFWADVQPVVFGTLPQLQDAVTVVGYPIGGDTMSVTSGVVSRIEVTSYVHGASELLGIQIDAAINSGNSGGPALNDDGECVGIAFQSLKHEDAENIGYIIPNPVIDHFIADYERNGKYTGFPCLGVEWQKMENPDLRSVMKMQACHKGVLIRSIEPTAPASKVLRGKEDVLLAFDGVPIANDGTVPFRRGERISFSYLVSQKYTNEGAVLRVLKDGQEVEVHVTLQAPVKLVPFHTRGLPPSYFIVAGLVFTIVTVPYLKAEYGKEWDFEAPVRLLDKAMHGHSDADTQQVVVLAQVLASDINIGYEEIINTQVLSVNGTKLHNLHDLVAAVDSSQDQYLVFDLDYAQKVVLNTTKAKLATQEILSLHCIASDRSIDLAGKAVGASQAAGPSTAAEPTHGTNATDGGGGSAPLKDTQADEPTGGGGRARRR